jgi:hypothetical protein
MITRAFERSASFGTRLGACVRLDASLLGRALFWRATLPLLKRTVPLRTLVRWMSPTDRQEDAAYRSARLETVRRFVADGGRLVVSENCLERSLMLYRFLAEAGADPRLVMGVNRDGNSTDGHAWIELAGEPLADTTTGRFTPMLVFGADGAVLPLHSCEPA